MLVGIDGGINAPAIAIVAGDMLYLADMSPTCKPKSKRKGETKEDYFTRRMQSVCTRVQEAMANGMIRAMHQPPFHETLHIAYEFPFTHNRVTRWSVAVMGTITGAMVAACGKPNTMTAFTPSRWQKIVTKEDAFKWVDTLEGEEFEMTDDMESATGVLMAAFGDKRGIPGVDKVRRLW